jgi:hypothetical protein
VLGAFRSLGLLERLADGEAIYPRACWVDRRQLAPRELKIDLHFLLSRGIVEQYDEGFRIAGHPHVRELVDQIGTVPGSNASPTQLWKKHFSSEPLDDDEEGLLFGFGTQPPRRTDFHQNHWVPTIEEIELGFRLVPLLLGMRQCGLTEQPERIFEDQRPITQGAIRIFEAAGWIADDAFTETGARAVSRGAGAFGIIEAYHPYMQKAADLLLGQRGEVWVQRSENVGASQDANRKTFKQANDAVDRFCTETGRKFSVFIEHAIGRGEATRQRFERSGDATIRYFGADLEDAAIDAAIEEQQTGVLPSNMVFVRHADIGDPVPLLAAISDAGADPHGAVMLVGNGFHEVRNQTDERMVDVFRGYCEAGLILVFTEENALSVDDLRATAFNTYHAGFKYVHEKSGQGLRPAHPRPIPRLGQPLRAPWSQCAERAGYVRLEEYCSRSRTVYPYTPVSGLNPSISVSHFMVPAQILSAAR